MTQDNTAERIKRVLAGKEKHCCILGPSADTTEAILRAVITRAIKAENSTHLVVQATDSEVLDVAVAWMPRLFGAHYPTVKYELDAGFKALKLANGAEIHFASTESEMHMARLMRRDYASIYTRRASELAPLAMASLRLHLCQRALQADGRQLKLKAYYDVESVAPDNWVFRDFIKKEPSDEFDPADSVLFDLNGALPSTERLEKPNFERPTEFDWALAKEICVRTADGEMLTSICSDDRMPLRSTVNTWLLYPDDDDKKEFATIYARAKELQADTFFDETLDIADDSSRDWKLVGKNKDQEVPNAEVIARSKLRVDTRLKLAALINPAKYRQNNGLNANEEDSGTLTVVVKGGLPAVNPSGEADANS